MCFVNIGFSLVFRLIWPQLATCSSPCRALLHVCPLLEGRSTLMSLPVCLSVRPSVRPFFFPSSSHICIFDFMHLYCIQRSGSATSPGRAVYFRTRMRLCGVIYQFFFKHSIHWNKFMGTPLLYVVNGSRAPSLRSQRIIILISNTK